jgi:hypothetical protein
MTKSAPLRAAGIEAAREYQDLPAWQKAVALSEQLFNSTFPSPELKALALDRCLNVATRIAASSVRTNEAGIAAGYLEAQSSVAELSTVLAVAARLGTELAEINEALDEVSRLIVGMRHGLKVKAKDEDRAEREEARLDYEHAQRQERPKREYKPRGDSEDRPRREFKPRDGDDRPRREYKPRGRDGEDRPKREYKPRGDGEDRPRREYKPRDDRDGERKPRRDFGDKKPYGSRDGGDRKPYGDKKPFGGKGKFGGDKKPYGKRDGGDRKSFGDKPSGKGFFRKKRDD